MSADSTTYDFRVIFDMCDVDLKETECEVWTRLIWLRNVTIGRLL
jgi:hypothetical protein